MGRVAHEKVTPEREIRKICLGYWLVNPRTNEDISTWTETWTIALHLR